MTGLIWFVQLVHYPLFARVGAAEWPRYADAHRRATSFLVAPLMGMELVAAVAIFLARRDLTTAAASSLLGVVWFSTAFVQVPLHQRLSRTFDPAIVRRLVTTNWIRTVAWTARTVLAFSMLGA